MDVDRFEPFAFVFLFLFDAEEDVTIRSGEPSMFFCDEEDVTIQCGEPSRFFLMKRKDVITRRDEPSLFDLMMRLASHVWVAGPASVTAVSGGVSSKKLLV
jgi:hypothetical protein